MALEPFIGELSLVGFNFAPRGWALCNGQLLAIAQNTALFSLLGTQYGGNGQTTFALPDLRGRVPIHQGQGPGLSSYTVGQMAGQETNTLTINQMPQHNHLLASTNTAATTSRPNGAILAAGGSYSTSPDGGQMLAQAVGISGGNQPHNIIQPYLTLNWVIALEGIFPSRN
jgi:microcystin-dependent protein